MSLVGLLWMLSLISLSSSLVIPNRLSVLLCKSKCKSYGGCTSVRLDSKHLQCELLFGTEKTAHTWEQGIRLFKVQDGTSFGCGRKERVVNHKRGSSKCVKVALGPPCEMDTTNEEPCMEAATVKSNDERSCILYKQENITVKPTFQLIELPLTMKPGMKLSVYGGTRSGVKRSTLSLTMAPENPRNILKWFHINLKWDKRTLTFRKGFSPAGSYDGDFSISDKSHFTVTVELTQSETKIYVDKIQVKTIALISEIKEFNLRKYYRIHHYVIQKTGGKCEKVNTGMS